MRDFFFLGDVQNDTSWSLMLGSAKESLLMILTKNIKLFKFYP